MSDQTVIRVDARGLRCPLPVLRLRKVAEGRPGALIELAADDPAAEVDVPAFAREMGWTIEATARDGAVRRWLVLVSASADARTLDAARS